MTVAKNVFNRVHVQRLLLAAALLGLSLTVSAAKLPGWQTAGMSNNGSKSFSISPGGGDLRVPIKNPGGGWQTAGNYGVQNPPTGTTFRLGADGQVFRSMPDGSTIKYPFKATSDLGRDAVIGGLGGLLSCGVACGVAAAGFSLALPFAADWLSRSDARLNPESGALERKAEVGGSYRCSFGGRPESAGPTARQCAQAAAVAGNRPPPDYEVRNESPTQSVNGWYVFITGTDSTLGQIAVRVVTAGAQEWIPASMDDIAPYMNSVAPNPGVVGEILNKGGDIELPKDATVTGPTSLNGPETTTTNADGSRTVQKTTYNFTTNGNTVTNTSNVTTTTIYNTDNSVRSSSSTSTTPTNDTAPEPEKEDPCKQNPELVSCMELDSPKGEIPRTTKNITFEAEDVLGGGSCPADVSMSFQTLGGQSAKIADWQTFCGYALPFRALVMGIAAIMAFFIIMPGGVRE